MEHNYQILVEYDGTNFVGWQYQKNGISIQEILEKKLKILTKEKIKIIGAGRTDAGVHAKLQSANFLVKKKIDNHQLFLNSINFFLKKYLISIISIKRRNLKFHSRFDALERVYEYIITNTYHGVYWATLLERKVIVLPFKSGLFSFKYPPVYCFDGNISDDLMNKAKVYEGILEEDRKLNFGFYNYLVNKYDLV